MPKSIKKFRQTKKIAAAAIISGIVLSGQGIYANEIGEEVKNDVNIEVEQNTETPKEETKEEVKVETEKEETKNEVNVEVEQNTETPKEETKEEVKVETEKEEAKNEMNVEVEQNTEISKAEIKEEKEDKKETSIQYREQLHYAIEEMKIAINLLDTADLTNDNNYERLNVFYKTAKNRIKDMEVLPEDQGHIDWIKESAKEIESKMYYINRVRYEVNRVNTVFDTARKDTLRNKQIVLDALGDSVEVGRYHVNSTTLNSAMKMYHELYADWDKELDEALTQLNYAIEETREAVNCKDNKDLTVKDNYDRMVAFMQAALDRLEGLYVLEGLENYSEHMNNLKANLKSVQDTAKLAKEIREAMDKVIAAFDNNLSREEKIQALDELGTLVDENRYNINTWTSYTAMELYHKYYALLGDEPAVPGEPDDDNTVDPEDPNEPSVPGEPDDDNTVDPEDPNEPAVPGEPDDDNTVDPEDPNEPAVPGEPDDDNTVDPENPSEPSVPEEPTKPLIPENPNDNNIVTPEKPNKPSTNNSNSGNNPKTGDISMLGYIGLGISSIAGLTINRKRK
jgi:hypothetical protein